MQIKTIQAERVLNPTSIDLGDYVINPYRGCSYGCMFCYVRFNKSTLKDTRAWGEYVDIRENSVELLEEELLKKKPARVLLGSTTECFQPIEKIYNLTRSILEVLTKNKVYYSILTRSPLITECIDIFQEGYCEKIYFTINNYPDEIKRMLEPKTPLFSQRRDAIFLLQKKNINVIAYCCPVLPELTQIQKIFETYSQISQIDFEGLNFNLGNIQLITKSIALYDKNLGELYERMQQDTVYYNQCWSQIRSEIQESAVRFKKNPTIFSHPFNDYFTNSYS